MAGETVLVVDDDEDLVDFYVFVLTKAGYKTAVASDGHAGIEAVKRLRPQAVILDMMMPDADGLEFLNLLREEGPKPPPVVIANSGFGVFEEEARKRGAAAFLIKPIEAENLLEVLQFALAGKLPDADLIEKHARYQLTARQGWDVAREALMAKVNLEDQDLQIRLEALVAWVTRYFGIKIAMINLLKSGKIHIQASFGGEGDLRAGASLDAQLSYCADVVGAGTALVLGDAAEHIVYKSHPASAHGLRFYAGAPLRTSHGVVIGTLCLLDPRPREFHSEDMAIIEHLALRVARQIEALAGVPNDGRFVFDEPGVFTSDSFRLLLGAELRRAGRVGGAINLALADLEHADPCLVEACAKAAYAHVTCERFSISEHSRGVLALLCGAGVDKDCIDRALAALKEAAQLRGAGVVSYDIQDLATQPEPSLEAMAAAALARAIASGPGSVERVLVARQPAARQ